MAFFQCDFSSETLGMACAVNVIYPEHRASAAQIGMKSGTDFERPPVLYLLHGQSDDQSIWMRRTSIERYVAEYGIAVVMPNGHRSYYCNQSNGMRFWDFMSEELPAFIESTFHVSSRREDTFVAGVSMGGYGALRLALRRPDRFSAVGAMSAVIDPRWLLKEDYAPYQKIYDSVFGNTPIDGSEFDLFHLADEVKSQKGAVPRLYLTCGDEDRFLADNQRFAAHLEAQKLDFQWHPAPGNHNWIFWDAQIQNILKWLL